MMSEQEGEAELRHLLEAAELEKSVNPGESHLDRARRILEEASAVASMSLVQLAQSAQSESIRLRAAVAILDRTLGDPRKVDPKSDTIWEELFQDVTVDKIINQ